MYTRLARMSVSIGATTACRAGERARHAGVARCYATSDGPVCHACTRNEALNNSLELVIKIFVVPMLFICIRGEALWRPTDALCDVGVSSEPRTAAIVEDCDQFLYVR